MHIVLLTFVSLCRPTFCCWWCRCYRSPLLYPILSSGCCVVVAAVAVAAVAAATTVDTDRVDSSGPGCWQQGPAVAESAAVNAIANAPDSNGSDGRKVAVDAVDAAVATAVVAAAADSLADLARAPG